MAEELDNSMPWWLWLIFIGMAIFSIRLIFIEKSYADEKAKNEKVKKPFFPKDGEINLNLDLNLGNLKSAGLMFVICFSNYLLVFLGSFFTPRNSEKIIEFSRGVQIFNLVAIIFGIIGGYLLLKSVNNSNS